MPSGKYPPHLYTVEVAFGQGAQAPIFAHQYRDFDTAMIDADYIRRECRVRRIRIWHRGQILQALSSFVNPSPPKAPIPSGVYTVSGQLAVFAPSDLGL